MDTGPTESFTSIYTSKIICPLSDTHISKTEYLDTYAYDGANVIRLLGGVLPSSLSSSNLFIEIRKT